MEPVVENAKVVYFDKGYNTREIYNCLEEKSIYAKIMPRKKFNNKIKGKSKKGKNS